ncbi:hypothetical protein CLV40_12870 [Actinokineospora auranticolor]|uniref:Uncharacterized protein n=1 Tax=Actinokineospora auranticolor TaxID=155976 RepID=A0A2S6GDZ1_9PSEU|nr:hypothetical protein CLV40_12870 [Actinokineospora auranticolor]
MGTHCSSTPANNGVTAAVARLIVDCDTSNASANSA